VWRHASSAFRYLSRREWEIPESTVREVDEAASHRLGQSGAVSRGVRHARKNIDLALVYKDEKADGGGAVSTSNGTIGLIEGTYQEVGIWAQVAFGTGFLKLKHVTAARHATATTTAIQRHSGDDQCVCSVSSTRCWWRAQRS
jgi:hypothetical protein